MNISIIQGNTQENITAPIIAKMYNLAVDQNNNITYSGNLYSPSAFGHMVDYLNTTFGPDLIITVPVSGRFINFQDSALESRIKTILGIDQNAGITEPDAADAIFTQSSFAGTQQSPNTSITSFGEFNYFTKANNNPPQRLFQYCTTLTNINLQNVTKVSDYEFSNCGLSGDLSLPNLTSLGTLAFKSSKISSISNLGETITKIPICCFQNCPNLVSVNIPLTVTEIENMAFSAYNTFYQLTTVTGLDNVTIYGPSVFNNQRELDLDVSILQKTVSLANQVFDFCYSLKGILNLPNLSVVGTTSGAQFRNSGITKIQCLGTISTIPPSCFQQYDNSSNSNKLTEAYLPYECNNIGKWAFYGNKSLTTVKRYNKSLSDYAEGETPVYTNLSTLTAINEGAFYYCNLLSMNLSDIPNVTTIGNDAFYNTLFGGALNSDKITTLGQNCFRQTLITSIHLPALISYTGKWSMFEGCTSLTSVTCLGKLDNIAQGMVKSCTSLTEVYVPKECTTLHQWAFYGCSSLTTLKQYTDSVDNWIEGQAPQYTNISRVTTFENGCFEKCTLLSLTPQDIENAITIGTNAFKGVQLSGNINLPNLTGTLGANSFQDTGISSISSLGSVTEIGDYAFENTNISSITIPNSVKKCGCNLVHRTTVPEIIFPEGVEEISGGQFWTKNDSLTYIEIPSTVTNMNHFFHRSLEDSQNDLCTVVIKATTPPTLIYYQNQANPTRGDKFAGIYVPDASLTAYQNGANAWQHSSIQAKLKPISQLQTDNPTAWAKYNRV